MKWFVVIAALLSASLASHVEGSEEVEPLALGSPAPDFELPGVDGKNYRLKDFSNAEILVVIFTCNHCPTAQAYEERIKKLVSDYKGKAVAFVAISPNDPLAVRLDELGYADLSDSFGECKIGARDHAFNFPYLYDGDKQEVSKAYGPRATPHVFIFDRQRKLRYRGAIDDSERIERAKRHYVRNALDALLSGKPILVSDTPAFGCSIKWSSKRDSVKEWMKKAAAEEVRVEKIGLEDVKALLKNESNKLRLINFWETRSGPSRTEFPELVTINRMYRGRNFEMVTISVDDPAEEAKVLSFLKEQQASCRNLLFDNPDRKLLVEATNKEWMGEVPLTLLVLRGGKIAYKHLGPIDPLDMKRAIVKILGRTY
jgi:thiol-disulfide isomerase/thioredoxin